MKKMHYTIEDQKDAIKFVEFMRKNRICAYIGSRCDCKFGIEEEASNKYGGEKNGCPEMRTLITILEHISEDAWKDALEAINRNKEAQNVEHRKAMKGWIDNVD